MKRLGLFLQHAGTILLAGILLICFFQINGFFNNKKSALIRSDGFGYYSFLPAIFIYNDYNQDFLPKKIAKHYDGIGIPSYMENINGKLVDKYFFGTAVMMYPFFITAHWATLHFNKPADGYSILYQYFIGLAAVFYAFLGIYFCDKLLRLFGANIFQSLFICLLILFGTNLFYYSVIEPSMSHAYSFSAISAFLYFSKAIIELRNRRYIIPLFVALGFLVLLRPINILIVFSLPFLAGGIKKLTDSLWFVIKNYAVTIPGAALAFCIVSLQFLIWYKQTGSFLVYSYTYERFYFDHPNILNVLFSYRKGLFLYTPLCLLSFAGLVVLYKKNRFAAISIFSFFLLLVYIMSCWHQWYYGSSFGFRPMIEYFSLFAVLLFFSFQLFSRKWSKILFILLCIATIPINQIQAFQYRKFILHWDRMSDYKYWKVFLKTNYQWYGYVWDNPEPEDLRGDTVVSYFNDFEGSSELWHDGADSILGAAAVSGRKVCLLDEKSAYSNTLILKKEPRIFNCNNPGIIATGYLNPYSFSFCDSVYFVVSYDHSDGQTYFYRSRLLDNFHRAKNNWGFFEIAMKFQKLEEERDVVKVYFWNPGKKKILLDNVSVYFMDLY
jgi:hypothetical protein